MQKILHLLTAVKRWVLAHKLISAVVVLVLLWGIATILGNGNEKPETLAVERGDFVQEVSVSGTVTAVSDVDLGFPQGGRVAGVYVSVGSRVGTGAVLVELENGDARASIEKEKAALASLMKGTRPEEVAVAEATVARDRDALEKAIGSAFITADTAIKTDVDQFFSNASGSSPQLSFTVSDSAVENAAERGRIEMGPLLAAWKADNAEVTLASVEHFLADVQAALARSIATGSVTQSALDGYAADVAGARTAVATALADVSAARAALAKDEKSLDLSRAGATVEDIAAQKARIAEAEAALRKTIIVAPFSGVVTAVPAKAGSILSASATAVTLIGANFQIEAYIPEVNVALVKDQDPAAVTLDAYPDIPFGAHVASIDPAETVRDGVSMYRSVLFFDTPDPRIRSGMTANVMITTLTKPDVIAIPQRLVTDTKGVKTVQILANGTPEARTVKTGALSSSGTIEITSGLSEGDIVIVPSAK